MQCCHWRCCQHCVSLMLAYASTDSKSHATHPSNSLDLQNTIVPLSLLLASNDTDVSIGTGTKSHIIPLNNHLNMLNAIVSLMATSACDRKHVIAMYVPKMGHLCQYIPHINSLESITWPETWVYKHFTLLAYAHEWLYLSNCTYMFHYTSTVVCTQSPFYYTCKFNYHNIVIYMPTRSIPFKCTIGHLLHVYMR